jgi:glycosyltransferase involved in cell wall biosynthesis
MRVAMIAPGEIFGGAERQILTLTTFLQQRDVHVTLLLFHDAELARRARELRMTVETLNPRSALDFSARYRLAQELAAGQFEVIHAHGYRAMVYAAMGRPRRMPILKTEHGGLEAVAAQARERAKLRFYRMVENAATRFTGATIVYVTQELQQMCSAEHRNIPSRVIANGIDPASLQGLPRPPELSPGEFNIVVVGRLEPVKGVEYAVRAMAQARLSRPARLHVIGDGPLRGDLERLAAELNVTDRVSFLGFRKDAPAFTAHADVLLMPSLHEGLPYTLLEAVAANTAVVASRVGGLAEVLEDGVTALLAPPENATSIAECLQRLAGDSDLGRQLARYANEKLMQRYGAARMGELYLDLYRELASAAKRSRN